MTAEARRTAVEWPQTALQPFDAETIGNDAKRPQNGRRMAAERIRRRLDRLS